jgi:DNA-binding MarR family transcriptional regulator
MSNDNEALLRAILRVTARGAIPPKTLAEIVVPSGSSEKQWKAYNLCDGSKTQGEIAKSLKLDSGNFSRTLSRWIDEGVVVRLGDGRDAKLLHVYPLTKEAVKQARQS